MQRLFKLRTICSTATLTILTAVAMGMTGCAGGGNVAPVTGTVTMDGEPLANATVTFMPQDEGGSSYGLTDTAGAYTLTYGREQEGAEIGEHKVMITTETSGDPDADPPIAASPETVPAEYNSATTLTATVEPGGSTIDFDLESGGEIDAVSGEAPGGGEAAE